MKKQTAGERKRTVTLTIGPLTEAWLKDLGLHLASSVPALTLTTVAGVCLWKGIQELSKTYDLAVPKGWGSASD